MKSFKLKYRFLKIKLMLRVIFSVLLEDIVWVTFVRKKEKILDLVGMSLFGWFLKCVFYVCC